VRRLLSSVDVILFSLSFSFSKLYERCLFSFLHQVLWWCFLWPNFRLKPLILHLENLPWEKQVPCPNGLVLAGNAFVATLCWFFFVLFLLEGRESGKHVKMKDMDWNCEHGSHAKSDNGKVLKEPRNSTLPVWHTAQKMHSPLTIWHRTQKRSTFNWLAEKIWH